MGQWDDETNLPTARTCEAKPEVGGFQFDGLLAVEPFHRRVASSAGAEVNQLECECENLII